LPKKPEFDWDEHNIRHVARHGVTPTEVQEAVTGRHVIPGPVEVHGENRWALYGTTAAGRPLAVVYTVRAERIRVVTAHTMHASDRRKYAAEID
jgi:uncharacterized DUF497 family protein